MESLKHEGKGKKEKGNTGKDASGIEDIRQIGFKKRVDNQNKVGSIVQVYK